ncbi:MAG: glutamate--tRNA ligase, partial [Myxococcales bacterium]|nr:glutamate--tRNA ligase [Myxococcales bacterium]
LDWDEGPERGGPSAPYRQSERRDLYTARVDDLIAAGHAYRCFCTPGMLEADTAEQRRKKLPPRYVGRCRAIPVDEALAKASSGERFTVRFRAPHGRRLLLPDLVRGQVSFVTGGIEDFMLLRSDGRPSYNLAVVVDDAAMGITHVLRGEDHLSNTPKQVLLAEALGHEPPAFGHLPLLLGDDGAPLSKRHGRASLADLRAAGHTPEGILNYLALCGWSHPEAKEILTVEELRASFDLGRVGGGGSIFDAKRLAWIDAHHLRAMTWERLRALCEAVAVEAPTPETLALIQPNLRTLWDARDLGAIFREPFDPGEDAVRALKTFDASPLLGAAGAVEAGDYDAFIAALKARAPGYKGKRLFMPLRLALTGREDGPELREIFAALGADRRRARLAEAARRLGGA